MRTIKNKTYNNFVYVMRIIQAKGYDKTESEQITHSLFDRYNPNGLSIIEMANRILAKAEYETEYNR